MDKPEEIQSEVMRMTSRGKPPSHHRRHRHLRNCPTDPDSIALCPLQTGSRLPITG